MAGHEERPRARLWWLWLLVAIFVAYVLSGDSIDAHTRAEGLIASGHFAAAAQALRAALTLQPANAASHTALGRCLAQLGQAHEAMAAFETAVHLDPRDDLARQGFTRLALHAAQTELLSHKASPAKVVLERVLATSPHQAHAYALLGRALELERSPRAALAAHSSAVRLAPDDAALHVNAALALYRAGRLGEAAESFERATALDPRGSLLAPTMLALSRPRADVHALDTLRRAIGMLGGTQSEAMESDPLVGTARALVAATPVEELGDFGDCSAAGLLERLHANGYVVCDRVLGLAALAQLREAMGALRPRMQSHEEAHGVHPIEGSYDPSARRDRSTRLPASDARDAWRASLGPGASESVHAGTRALRTLLYRRLHALLLHALPAGQPPLWPKEELQLACYDVGGYYRRHADAAHRRGVGEAAGHGDEGAGGEEEGDATARRFTAIYYANDPAWPLGDGGGLQIWPQQPPHGAADGAELVLAPRGDRLLVFDSALEHEVLVNRGRGARCAFTQWFWSGLRLRA